MILKSTCFQAMFWIVFASTSLFGQLPDASIYVEHVDVEEKRIYIDTHYSDDIASAPSLVVVLHGDSPFNKPSYHYAFAKSMAEQGKNVAAIGVLRPGYTDALDRTSDGERGEAVGDNYGPPQLNQIAQAIGIWKAFFEPKQVVVVGHSGGAAITALLGSQFPGLIDHAVLVACPCDVNAWRESMFALTSKPIFKGDLDVLSPQSQVAQLAPDLETLLIVGKKDPVTPVKLSKNYEQALKKLGRKVRLVEIPGEHDILLTEAVQKLVLALL